MSQPSSLKRSREHMNTDEDNSDCEYEDESDYEIDSDFEADIENSNEYLNNFHSSSIPTKLNIKSENTVKESIIKVHMCGKDPIDYFNLMANEEFYNFIMSYLNIQDVKKHKEKGSKFSCGGNFTCICKHKVWLGLLLHMGTIKLNRINDYWKKHNLFNFKIFSQYMPRDKFIVVLKSLRFNRNRNILHSLDRIKPLIDYFNKRMNDVYISQNNNSVVLWRGKFLIREFLRGKEVNSNIKLHMLGESNGIALKLVALCDSLSQTLTEKKTESNLPKSSHDDSKKNCSKKSRITDKINENIEEKNIKIEKCDDQILDKKSPDTKWEDPREALDVSSESNEESVKITKPKIMIQYNKCMKNTLYHKHMLSYYPCRKKMFRWDVKLAIHVIQNMLLNSYYLYNLDNGKTSSFYDFRLAVIEKLLGSPLPTIKMAHIPSFCPKDDNNKTKRRRCKYCWSTHQERKDSIFYCSYCPDKPGLCLEPCFKNYHEGNM